MNFLQKIYENLLLDRPIIMVFIVFLGVLFLGYHAQNFRLDASSDSLTLENDKALKYYRSIKARYGSDDYLIITYTPKADLFEAETLSDLQDLRDGLIRLDHVDSVTSILDVPLMNSPPVTINELSANVRTLASPDTDKFLAKQELITSPLYQDLLMSRDGETTALLVVFHMENELMAALEKRDSLREKALETSLTKEESKQLKQYEKEYAINIAQSQKRQERDIASVREILNNHKDKAEIYLGGMPMIVVDSIDFIRKDLLVFGIGIFSFLILLLIITFRKPRWVILPLLTCFCVCVSVVGFLGLVDWPVTVVSSNFISLLLIFTLSFCVHQIVRYRECQSETPDADQRSLVQKTVRSISIPCFYMVFTTIVAFGSLVVSDIRPIIDFGWMMAIGLAIAFVISFTLFPAALMFLKPSEQPNPYDITNKITVFFAALIRRRGNLFLGGFALLIILSVIGMNFLYVQNRFIDYYKESTEIYRGMETIDYKLGGTTPLDVIIDAPQDFLASQRENADFAEEDDFVFEIDSDPILEGYWFGDNLLKEGAAVHTYLDELPETGKVLSLYTSARLLENLKDAEPINRFYMGVLYNKLPDYVRDLLFEPYISKDGNQLRFSVRMFESHEGLDREEFLKKVQKHLTTTIGLEENQVHVTGMLVLYNNVLQSLFHSQIMTIWVVFVTMFIIFIILFRNIKIAAVAIIPNITITMIVLGLMGWLHIPLDIMTITIAAICFGSADDNTIHYVHRMKSEFEKDRNYWRAIEKSHTTIGRAMYYTSITVILGFSILAFSNFVPTIYFGLLTGFSMFMALFANLALLPLLMVWFKPFGKEKAI